jgi:hypothetical protein
LVALAEYGERDVEITVLADAVQHLMRLWRAERGVDYINHKIILGVWVGDSAIVLDYELLGFYARPGKV